MLSISNDVFVISFRNINLKYSIAGGEIFSWFWWLKKKKTHFQLTNVLTTCMCAQLAASALKSTHMVCTRFYPLSCSHGAWFILARYFEKNVDGVISLLGKEE